jgi:hypothetical protein
VRQMQPWPGDKVAVAAGPQVVGMGVGDHRPGHRTPWVDPKIPGRAIKPLISRKDEGMV